MDRADWVMAFTLGLPLAACLVVLCLAAAGVVSWHTSIELSVSDSIFNVLVFAVAAATPQ